MAVDYAAIAQVLQGQQASQAAAAQAQAQAAKAERDEAKAEAERKRKEDKEQNLLNMQMATEERRRQDAKDEALRKEAKEDRLRAEAKLEQDKKDAEAKRRAELDLEKEKLNAANKLDIAKLEKQEARETRIFDAQREDAKFEQAQILQANKRKSEAEALDKTIRANRTDLIIGKSFDVFANVFSK